MNSFNYKVTIAADVKGYNLSLKEALDHAKFWSNDDFPHHYAVWADDSFVVAIAYGGNLIFDDTKNQQARERIMEQAE